MNTKQESLTEHLTIDDITHQIGRVEPQMRLNAGIVHDNRLRRREAEKATYSWPCAKQSCEKKSPTHLSDWPCDLLVVVITLDLDGENYAL